MASPKEDTKKRFTGIFYYKYLLCGLDWRDLKLP
jgi:hypothetical protein